MLCARAALPEPLLLELRNAVAHECSGEGEGSLSGNLSTQQIVVSLWLFVRHLPMMQAQAPFSPLTPLLPPLIERLLLLITDLASLTAHHLCEVLYVLARLQRSGGLLNRLLQQAEQRLAMGLGLEFATPSPSPNPSPNPHRRQRGRGTRPSTHLSKGVTGPG